MSKDTGVRYIHYRRFKSGQVLPKGGLTVAYERVGNNVACAIAVCSRKDHFNKKLGRVIAQGRLAAGNAWIFIPQDQEQWFSEFQARSLNAAKQVSSSLDTLYNQKIQRILGEQLESVA